MVCGGRSQVNPHTLLMLRETQRRISEIVCHSSLSYLTERTISESKIAIVTIAAYPSNTTSHCNAATSRAIPLVKRRGTLPESSNTTSHKPYKSNEESPSC